MSACLCCNDFYWWEECVFDLPLDVPHSIGREAQLKLSTAQKKKRSVLTFTASARLLPWSGKLKTSQRSNASRQGRSKGEQKEDQRVAERVGGRGCTSSGRARKPNPKYLGDEFCLDVPERCQHVVASAFWCGRVGWLWICAVTNPTGSVPCSTKRAPWHRHEGAHK